MRFALQLLGVVAVATAIDLVVRLGGFASFAQVLLVEAFLFPLTGVALDRVIRCHGRSSGLRRGLEVILVWAFVLAGLRAGIWAVGLPVGTANLVILSVALLAWVGYRIRKRQKAPEA